LLLSVLAAGAMLAGCGGGSMPTNSDTHSPTLTGSSTSALSAGSTGAVKQPGAAPAQLTDEEMREYDGNEGRCHDDGGTVRGVGTVNAYCAFPNRANDFHLVEAAQEGRPSGEEE
jgi:hypothetical protein